MISPAKQPNTDPFFFSSNIIYGENIIPYKMTRREIYYIERENGFPFTMESHSSLSCMHPVALFTNTCRERVTENINLRSETHLYSGHRLHLVKSFLANNVCIGIPIKIMFLFLLFVFFLKTMTKRRQTRKRER